MPDFPPPTITKWLRRETINAKKLADELREWADYFEDERPGPPKHMCREG